MARLTGNLAVLTGEDKSNFAVVKFGEAVQPIVTDQAVAWECLDVVLHKFSLVFRMAVDAQALLWDGKLVRVTGPACESFTCACFLVPCKRKAQVVVRKIN